MRNDFEDMSPRGRFLTAAVTLISLVVVTAAERDLQRRPDSDIRGSKLLWRLVCLNAVGAGAYFRWGRREGSKPRAR